jgi:hypothetical protein
MRFASVAAVVVVPLAACFYDNDTPLPEDFGVCTAPLVPDETLVPDAPTWYRDVEPIVIKKCQGCHVDGGIGPFPLIAYADVAQYAPVIHEEVDQRRMPPWQPDPCCDEYLHDRSLSEEQRATVLRWIETGMAAGAPDDAPPVDPPPLGLPRVDLRAVMPEPYTPQPQVGADELRCFLLEHAPIDRTRYITGFDFQPGVRGEVHHVIVYAVDDDLVDDLERKSGADGRPGWDCYGEAGELAGGRDYIGGWQPGVPSRLLPAGIGRELEANTRIMISIHYDTGHGVAPDLSAIDIMLDDQVDRLEMAIPVGNPLWLTGEGMHIAANDPDAIAWFAYDPTVILGKGKSMDVHNVMVHMHELGTIGRVGILRDDGTTDCLVNITKWDFHWMADYYFAAPVRIRPGDRVVVECHWDNTADNQKFVNGERQVPRDLGWKTDEEMCGAVLTYSIPVEDS